MVVEFTFGCFKGQAVITEKYGAHGCSVGEDGGLAPNISRQVLTLHGLSL